MAHLHSYHLRSKHHRQIVQGTPRTPRGHRSVSPLWKNSSRFCDLVSWWLTAIDGSVSKPCTPVVHIKIAGKWMFIPLIMVIGIDTYPYSNILWQLSCSFFLEHLWQGLSSESYFCDNSYSYELWHQHEIRKGKSIVCRQENTGTTQVCVCVRMDLLIRSYLLDGDTSALQATT